MTTANQLPQKCSRTLLGHGHGRSKSKSEAAHPSHDILRDAPVSKSVRSSLAALPSDTYFFTPAQSAPVARFRKAHELEEPWSEEGGSPSGEDKTASGFLETERIARGALSPLPLALNEAVAEFASLAPPARLRLVRGSKKAQILRSSLLAGVFRGDGGSGTRRKKRPLARSRSPGAPPAPTRVDKSRAPQEGNKAAWINEKTNEQTYIYI